MNSDRPANPILGFGPIGLVASLVLLAVIIAALAGFDFQYHYVYLLGAIVGGERALYWVALVHVPLWLVQPLPQFNLVSLAIALPALFVYPTPRRWWQYGIVSFWAVFHGTWFWIKLEDPLLEWMGFGRGGIQGVPALWRLTVAEHAVGEAIACAVTALVMWAATGSWRVAAAIQATAIVFAGAAWILEAAGWLPSRNLELVGLIAWHGAFAAIVWTWAVAARRRVVPQFACAACGYDLRLSDSSTCPECGAAREALGRRGKSRAWGVALVASVLLAMAAAIAYSVDSLRSNRVSVVNTSSNSLSDVVLTFRRLDGTVLCRREIRSVSPGERVLIRHSVDVVKADVTFTLDGRRCSYERHLVCAGAGWIFTVAADGKVVPGYEGQLTASSAPQASGSEGESERGGHAASRRPPHGPPRLE